MRQRKRQPDSNAAAVSRRRFLTVAGASAAMLPALASGQPAPGAVTKETLRPMVDVAELAITDEQLGKVAGAMAWARGELRKLREVETGLIGPAPMFLPPAPTARGGDGS